MVPLGAYEKGVLSSLGGVSECFPQSFDIGIRYLHTVTYLKRSPKDFPGTCRRETKESNF